MYQRGLETWFDLYVVPSKLAPSTVAMYRRSINAVPLWLGNTPLEQLSPVEVQRWLVTVARSTPVPRSWIELPSPALSRWPENLACAPACSMKIPCQRWPMHRESPCLHPRGSSRLSRSHQAHPEVTRSCSSALCGLRRGEALGLRWTDVDQSTGTISISRQRQRINRQYQTRPLKSSSARRVLVLPPDAPHHPAAATHRVRLDPLDATPEQLRNDHLAAIKAMHLPPVTIHGLRHTMATIATSSGNTHEALTNIHGSQHL